MSAWVVREYSPDKAEPVFESAELHDYEGAVMYCKPIALALATLYGNPKATPVVIRESDQCWRVNMDFPNHADHNYTTIRVEEADEA